MSLLIDLLLFLALLLVLRLLRLLLRNDGLFDLVALFSRFVFIPEGLAPVRQSETVVPPARPIILRIRIRLKLVVLIKIKILPEYRGLFSDRGLPQPRQFECRHFGFALKGVGKPLTKQLIQLLYLFFEIGRRLFLVGGCKHPHVQLFLLLLFNFAESDVS